MTIYTEKNRPCPQCGKSKSEFLVDRVNTEEGSINSFKFECSACKNVWLKRSTRYQEVDDKDLVRTFKFKWENACREARRGNHEILDGWRVKYPKKKIVFDNPTTKATTTAELKENESANE